MSTGFSFILATAVASFMAIVAAPATQADDKALIDNNTQRAVTWLNASHQDTAKLLEGAAGVLVFPDMVKMGFGVGGEFGEGALLVGGEVVEYYAIAGDSFGLGPEADFKAEVIVFQTEEALQSFRDTTSWKVGEHAAVPVMSAPVKGEKASSEPVVGLIFSEDGMASDLGLEGSKVTLIVR
jgi:lipid-binding SYLF domain-containing protein